jgi:hypothetical protein
MIIFTQLFISPRSGSHLGISSIDALRTLFLNASTLLRILSINCDRLTLANQLLKKWRKKKIALLIDEVFQAIGLDKVEVYVKSLLNIIEYPPESYENIVIIVARGI